MALLHCWVLAANIMVSVAIISEIHVIIPRVNI